jgi:putative addiction module component (TIGR02574 family)
MNARIDHLLDEALLLSMDERSALALALLDSLEGGDEASITDAWRAEILRRRAGLRDGSIVPVPWADAKARLSLL